MITALLAGIVAGYGIAIPVGAVGTFLVSLSARTSLRIGAAAGLGVATADAIYATVAVVAGTSVATLIRPVAGPLRIAAGAALLGLAVWGAASAVLRHRSAATITDGGRFWTARRAYFGLLGVTVLNPATVVYFAALVLGNAAILSSSVLAAAVFVAAVFGASASWQLLLAGGGVVLGRWLTGPRGALVTAVGSSVIIAALAVNVLLSA